MLHGKRTWGPPRRVDSPEELSELLTERTWTLCSAFEHAGYFYLNDSTSENGAQEFAVLKGDGSGFLQVETITFGWCSKARALELIREVSSGRFDAEGRAVSARFDFSPHHSCELCA